MARLTLTQRLASTAVAAAILAGFAVPSMAQPAPAASTATTPAAAEQAAKPKPHHGPRAERNERGERGGERAHKFSPEQREQAMAKRADALKQKLQLTAAQDSAWTNFQASMKPDGKPTLDRLDRAEMEKLSTPERIDRMRALRAQHAAEADRRGEAVKTFYAALTPAQQKTFDIEGPRFGGHHAGHHGMEGHGDRKGPRGHGPDGKRGERHHGGEHGKHRPAGPGAAPSAPVTAAPAASTAQ